MRSFLRSKTAYALLLGAQTLVAIGIFLLTFPIFRGIITRVGQPQEIGAGRLLALLGSIFVLQGLYWLRFSTVPIQARQSSPLMTHIMMFIARISFFYGAAFFSLSFFRHFPDLDPLPPTGQIIVRAILLVAVLFSLFCYSLELERLARATEASDFERRAAALDRR